MSVETVLHVVRLLSDVPGGNNTSGSGPDMPQTSQTKNQGRDVYEFAAFLSWYLVLILCCAVPALCAYRRRRLRERRRALMYMRNASANGQRITIITSGSGALAFQEERLKERTDRINELIRTTTMTVTQDDLVAKDKVDGKTKEKDTESKDEEKEEADKDDSYMYDSEHEYAALRLISKVDNKDVVNGSRNVPPACAICLAPYAEKDVVTWSPKPHCQHAFHKDCIVPWLAKKVEPLCPCCRQEFCDLPVESPVLEFSIEHPDTATTEISRTISLGNATDDDERLEPRNGGS